MLSKSTCIKHRVLLFAVLVLWIGAVVTLTRVTASSLETTTTSSITSSRYNTTKPSIPHDGTSKTHSNYIGAEWSTLSELYRERILSQMPTAKVEYRPPSSKNLRDMEHIVGQMMNLRHPPDNDHDHDDDDNDDDLVTAASIRHACSSIDLLSLREMYEIGIFEDVEQLEHTIYCVLVTTSSDFPWGTVIVRPITAGHNSNGHKNLSIDCPHPLHDRFTGEQSAAVFQGTQARSLVLSGAYRYASNETSCQGGQFRVSDAAHSSQNGFHAAVTAIWKHYQDYSYNSNAHDHDFRSIQFHGMGASTCEGVDAYLTDGMAATSVVEGSSSSFLLSILSHELASAFSKIRNETLILTPASKNTAGTSNSSPPLSLLPSCSMSGSTNLQGRLWNGVPPDQVCTMSAAVASGRFVHVEQKAWMRDPQLFPVWVEVLNQAYDEYTTK
jgi:hypothetical protein